MENSYITELGMHFKDIRNLMNWTQKDIADKLGISRNTVINIEQNPTTMKKTIAYSLYLVVITELDKRKDRAENIDYSKINTDDKEEIKSTFYKLGLTGTLLSSGILLPALVTILGGAVGGLLGIFSSQKKKSIEDLNSEEIKMITEKSIAKIEEKIEDYFGLDDLYNSREFVGKVMDKGNNSNLK